METQNQIKAKEIAESVGADMYYETSFKRYLKEDVYNAALQAMQWKDEQHNEEKRDLLELVKMLKIDERNQTIIEDLVAILNS